MVNNILPKPAAIAPAPTTIGNGQAAPMVVGSQAPLAARRVGRPKGGSAMTAATGDERIRMTVDFPPSASIRLKELKETIEAPSYVDVLRKALAFYEAAVEAQQAGGRVYVETGDGKITEWTQAMVA